MTKYGVTAAQSFNRFRIIRTKSVSRPRNPQCAVGVALLAVVVLSVSPLLAEDASSLSCIQQVEVPVYAGVLWQARISGTATVRATLDEHGRPSKIRVDSPHPSLTKWLTSWFNHAAFLPQCGGRTMTVELTYMLEGAKRESPDNRVILKYPGIIQIIAHPPILHPSVD